MRRQERNHIECCIIYDRSLEQTSLSAIEGGVSKFDKKKKKEITLRKIRPLIS